MKFQKGHTYSTTHGHARKRQRTRAYRSWEQMRSRCNKPTDKDYPDYGGRGITVCELWRDFAAFIADMGEPPPGMTLDRRDNNKGYCRENCRWATAIEQHQNTRANIYLTFAGETLCISEWERRLGFPKDRIGARLKQGWPVERALTTPMRAYPRKYQTLEMIERGESLI